MLLEMHVLPTVECFLVLSYKGKIPNVKIYNCILKSGVNNVHYVTLQGFPDFPSPPFVKEALARVAASSDVAVNQYTRSQVSVTVTVYGMKILNVLFI